MELNGFGGTLSFLDKNTGENIILGTVEKFKAEIETEIPKKYEKLKIPTSASGTLKLKNPKKFQYEILGIKNSYYKHLKRVKNRNKLYEKKR
jgi:hypothetical protein